MSGCAYDTSPAGPWGRDGHEAGRGTVHGARRVDWRHCLSGDRRPGVGRYGLDGRRAPGAHRERAPLGQGARRRGNNNVVAAPPSAELYDPGGNAAPAPSPPPATWPPRARYHTATVLPSGKVLVAGGNDPPSVPRERGGLRSSRQRRRGHLRRHRRRWPRRACAPRRACFPRGRCSSPGDSPTAPRSRARSSSTLRATEARAAFALTGDMFTCTLPAHCERTPLGQDPDRRRLHLRARAQSAEIFDPTGNGGAGTFAATGNMATPRWGHTASVLPSGKILIAGGGGSGDASAELFDPAGNAGAGTFAATGLMTVAHGRTPRRACSPRERCSSREATTMVP